MAINVMYNVKVEDNVDSLYDLYGHALAQEPCPGGHEIYNFVRPCLVLHNYRLNVSAP